MKTSIFFVARITIAWVLAWVLALIIWLSSHNGGNNGPAWPFVLVALLVVGWKMTSAISHLRRVRLIVGKIDEVTVSNRQRRQIEIPFEAGEAFDIVDATIRELPRVEGIESARDSLQVRAKVKRLDPYGKGATNVNKRDNAGWSGIKRNQIMATVTPGDGTGSVTLICEPEAGAWIDWFQVDDGTNLENAEAITRAIARRVADKRRGEQASAKQTSTEKELTVAKLSLLHAQVEPHFLYNTLASAQLLTRSDPPRADEMLGNLILYLRHSLPRTDDAPSTLGEELERARAYLEILKIRMGSRLNLQIEVADALKSALFPTMMLQTLVENAIKHGLGPLPEGGLVRITASERDGGLVLQVRDTGRGFQQASGGGTGLANIRARLAAAFGTGADLALDENTGRGICATLTLPSSNEQIIA